MYLTSYIECGLNLASLIHLWKKDNSYTNKGGKIYYAVDTGIVKMYSDVRNNYNYSRLFPDDTINSLEGITHALSSYIFSNKISNNNQLILLHPHNKELKRIIYAIMMSVADEKFDLSNNIDQIKDIFDTYSVNKDDKYLIDQLQGNVLDLVCFLFDENRSFAAELSKITALLSERKIVSLGSYNGDLIPDLYDTTNSSHYDILREYSSKWRDLLRMHAPHKDEDKLYVDAEVLARVEYINSQFILDNSQETRLLVLITGDSSIHKATMSYPNDSDEKFYDLYIRDPKVFLAANDLFYISHDKKDKSFLNENDFADWVNLSLSGISHCMERHPECQVDICNRVNDVNKIKKVRDKWSEYVSNNLLNSTLKQNYTLQKLKDLISNNSFKEIENKIDQRISSIWIDCWKLSTQVGYSSVKEIESSNCGETYKQNSQYLLPLRSIPALKLTYPKAMGIVYKLCEQLFHDRIINSQEIFKKLEKEDPSDYTAFLVYALAFGAAGKWRVSCILSKIALSIADDPSRDNIRTSNTMHEPIKGDEAAYVLAWSTRHTSTNAHSLKKAKEYIDDAKKRKIEASGIDYDMRYECESIAIDMAYNMYYLFLPDKKDFRNYGDGSDVEGLNDSKAKLRSIVDNVGTIENNGSISLQMRLINLMIRRQSITYYYFVIIVLLYKCKAPVSQEDLYFAKNHLLEFKCVLNTKKYKVKSFMNYIIYLISVLLFSESNEKNDIEKELYILLDREYVKQYCVMPYDSRLYEFFKGIVKEYI